MLGEGRPAIAVFLTAATWRRALPEALLCVFHWLTCSGRVSDAATLVLELTRWASFSLMLHSWCNVLKGAPVITMNHPSVHVQHWWIHKKSTNPCQQGWRVPEDIQRRVATTDLAANLPFFAYCQDEPFCAVVCVASCA